MNTSLKTLALVLASFLLMAGAEPTADQTKAFDETLQGFFEEEPETLGMLRELGVADEDLAVVLMIAREGKTSPERIAKLRLRGETWPQIAEARSIGKGVFYFLISGDITSKTYGPIFEKFRNPPPGGMSKIVLSDEDVVNMVNLRFISSHHDYSVFKVMAMRDNGKQFARINHDVKQIKKEMVKEEKRKKKEAAKAAEAEETE